MITEDLLNEYSSKVHLVYQRIRRTNTCTEIVQLCANSLHRRIRTLTFDRRTESMMPLRQYAGWSGELIAA